MFQSRVSGKFLITNDIQLKNLDRWGPRPENPRSEIGLAMVRAITQTGTKFKSFCLKSAPMGQPLLAFHWSSQGTSPTVQSWLWAQQTKPHDGKGFAQGPSSTVVYMQTYYCFEGFSTSAGSFYLSASSSLQMWSKLLGNCRRVGGCVRNQLGRVSREKVICYDMVSWLFMIVGSLRKDFWLLEG